MPSPRRQGRRAIRGTIILLTLTTLGLGIFFLDSLLPLVQRTYSVVALFPTAPGVRPGSPVWVAGVLVGKIRRVELLPPWHRGGRVALDLEMKRSVAEQIRRDSEVRITSTKLVGEKVVDVLPGSPGSPRLPAGDTLRIVVQATTMEDLGRTAEELSVALDSVRHDAASLVPRMDQRRREMAAIMRQAGAARREFDSLRAGMSGGSIARLASLQRPGGPLESAQLRVAAVQRLLGDAARRTGRAGRELTPEQRRLAVHLHQLRGEIAAFRALLAQPTGTLGRAQRDSALLRALQDVRADLDSLVAEPKRHPLRFLP